MDKKPVRIFGYGSLLSENSLRGTVPSARNIKPVRLYGFVRVFNFPGSTRVCEQSGVPIAVLNVEKSEWNQCINGIVFEMDEEDLDKLITREQGYELVQVEVEDYHNKNNKMKAHFFRTPHYEAYPYQFESEEQRCYLDLCFEGCEVFGEEFLEEFVKTTYIDDKTMDEHDHHMIKKDKKN